MTGTTGEAPTMTDAEKLAFYEAVIDEVGGEAHLVAGTGTYDTAHRVHLTREAAKLGVEAFLAVTPYYSKPPPEGIVRHFAAIAEAAGGRPVIAYNIPQRVVLNLPPELLERLAREVPSVIAVKQATTDLDQARAIVDDGAGALRRQRRPLLPFAELGGMRRHLRRLAPDRPRAGPRRRARPERRRRGRPRARGRAARGLRRARRDRQPDPGQGRDGALRHRVGEPRLPLVPARTTSARIRGCWSAGACSCARERSRPHHPARRPRSDRQQHDRVRAGADRIADRRRPQLPARRDARHRPRAAGLQLPARHAGHAARDRHHARPRGPRRRACRGCCASTGRSRSGGRASRSA